ncbi:MAG TPA: ABC transporter permease, partial [Candidatus Sulfopaludibacter sp.]|nr:ABC transporter permease [Candidatus Sulfopaludibacter sp.]
MLLEDVRYGARSIARSPLLSCATVLTLALGIGINTGVFTLLNGLLLRARVASHPESFVHLSPEYSGETENRGTLPFGISVADYRAFTHARSIGKLAAWGIAHATLGRDNPQPELAMMVSCNFFSVYGLEQIAFGRLFREEECATAGSAPVAVLSEEFWRRRLDADPQVLGTKIVLNRQAFTVVGIVPAGFSGRLRGPGIWVPYTMEAPFFGGANLFEEDALRWLIVEGRLKPGAPRESARAELAVIAHQQDALHPGRKTAMVLTNGSFIEEPSLRAQVIWIGPLIMGALTLILLLACTNVTTLLLSRAAARRREIAIRLSLGAGRKRLLRMLLAESLMLAGAAGAISAYVAWRMPAVFQRLYADAPNYPLQPNLLVFGYLAAVTLAAGCMAGSAPAAESLQVDLTTALKGQES